jgi:hypothetical protein
MESKSPRIVAILIAGIISLSVSSLAADTYRWKDKDGKVHYGAAVPAEYAEQPYDILNKAGIVIEHVEDTSVPIEVRVEEEIQGRKPLISEEERRRQSDRLLVIQYRSEEEINEWSREKNGSATASRQTLSVTASSHQMPAQMKNGALMKSWVPMKNRSIRVKFSLTRAPVVKN